MKAALLSMKQLLYLLVMTRWLAFAMQTRVRYTT
ncbi:hypothetical protein SAMN06295960_0173 [Paenibacillus aquistagni]|uniref:Uncharacterized protein n=1 Tax=Paenibacillus aquistagni TaxID=1852522 RepID=A0A1X7I6K8_9BACL|nr:hypothetical protein SAMN06295960_0173 [Paenibacillus aquistagni]